MAWAILRKDARLDLRSRDRAGHMAMFAFILVALLSITLPSVTSETRDWLPSLFWVVLLLTSLLGLGRSFQSEVEDGAITALVQVPCDRGWVFLGKAGANALALGVVLLWTAVLFEIFLDLGWQTGWRQALGVGLLGSLGLATIGTLLGAMAVAARFRDFLLPVLLFPLVLPILVFASQATGVALKGIAIPIRWWSALLLYDLIVVLVGYFCFDAVLED